MSEQVVFEVLGNTLTGGVTRTEHPRAVVVLCHGIPSGGPDEPEDRGYPGLADDIADSGYEVWWFNFRGARDSSGVFTYGGWIEDLHAVIKQISSEDLPLFVVGSSAGGAVALMAAAESPLIAGVVTLASPAYWLRDDGDGGGLLAHARRIGLIPPGFPTDEDEWWSEFETNRPEWAIELMAGRPALIIQGTDDPAVRPLHGQRLFENAREPKTFLLLEGAGHQLRRDHRALDAILDWLQLWSQTPSARLPAND